MKAIIITGISSGLGKALFDSFVDKDVQLIGISRRFLPYQEELAQSQPERVTLLKRDLQVEEQIPSAQDFAALLEGKEIEELVFINNAAVISPIGPVGTFENAQITQATMINFIAPIQMINNLVSLGEKTKLNILHISSGAAKRALGGWSLYCSTKAGAEMFVDVCKAQFENNPNIQIHSISPGVMDTQMQEYIRSSVTDVFPERVYFVDLKEQGKVATPEMVAQKIVAEYIPWG
ncbi:SDR family NAD(P)-dependent oxidoreductase [Brevibacillus dissolubilis]|uniref:SDR family NAD(P)-dependent oxidoreductase n=1 Tax=Brevibacillus dissolubilis TaxID=1844116 RepID=UPI00159B8D0C|nr:SDR family NAD(P)-dependent oxidoreductase [Brevibacillus dissolubilis]